MNHIPSRVNVALLSAGHFLNDFYCNFLPILLPVIIPQLGLSLTLSGLLIMVMSITSNLLQPVFGYIMDKHDWRRLLVPVLPFGAICICTIGFLTTKAMLSLRADHAMAKDAVLKPVDEGLLQRMDLPLIQSKCEDIDTHLTRPDLGRQLSDEAKAFLQQHCEKNPQIQVYVSDGLSNSAVEHNIEDLLPILMDGLKADGIRVGTPFFVKYGRVPTMDAVSEAVGAELTCVLLGERPGLAASDSMSAYITYGAYVGIPESKRTVVSNIHQHGIQPVEAGAYLVELLERILNEQKSGVDLQL